MAAAVRRSTRSSPLAVVDCRDLWVLVSGSTATCTSRTTTVAKCYGTRDRPGPRPGSFVDAAISWTDVSLSTPTEITFDASGFLYVSSRGTNSVVRSGVNSDFYQVTAVAGTQLTFTTTTPGDGPGEFVNTLDPACGCTTQRATRWPSTTTGQPTDATPC